MLDKNKEPVIIIPNRKKNSPLKIEYFKITFDQTAAYVHYMRELDMKLPNNFEVDKYLKLDKQSRIKYAKEIIPRNKLIQYQNRLAEEISDPSCKHHLGHWSVFWRPCGIITRKYESHVYTLTVINSYGTHILTYKINDRFYLLRLEDEDFWIWRDLPAW